MADACSHIWEDLGAGLYVCLLCDAEEWDDDELDDYLDEEYADWGGAWT